MKVFPSNISKINSIGFGQQNTSDKRVAVQNSTPAEIGRTTADYNINTPIPYTKTEEINLNNNTTAHCYKLANGQKVVIIPKEGTTVVKTYVNTGSLNEEDKIRGISHYIEHNLFNGSEALGDKLFFDEVKKMGANTNASTSFSVTDYYIESQLLEDTDLENKIKLHAGMLQSPKFLQEKLDKEKKIVNSEINMYLSDELSRATTLVLKNLFNIKSNSPDLIAGSTNNIDALTREDVVNYFNNNYYPANMVTVITGEVEPQKTIELISKYFNSKKIPTQNRHFETMIPTEKAVRKDLISAKNDNTAQIVIGFAGPENNNIKDKIYLRALNHLLFGLADSKITEIEKKYSAPITRNSERLGTKPQDKQAQILETAVLEKNVEPLLKDFYKMILQLQTTPPTQEEFEAVKNQIKKDNSIYMQSSAALNNQIGMDFINGSPYKLRDYSKILDNMTYNDFINTAKKYYDLNKISLVVVHPKGTDEKTINENYQSAGQSKISFTGALKKTPISTDKITQYKSQNNFDLTLNDKSSDVVNYSISIASNKWLTNDGAVIDVLNDMLQFCGTKNHSWQENAKNSDKNAIKTTINVDGKGLYLDADFQKDKTKIALDMFTEILLNPNLNEKLFKESVQRCRERYMTSEPNAYENLNKLLYKNLAIGQTDKDKLERLDSLTLEDVRNFYKQILINGQGNIVTTAPFSSNPEIKTEIFNNAYKYNQAKPKDISLDCLYSPITKPEIHTVETNRNQAEVMESFKFKNSGNIKDDVCYDILNTLLGGSTSSRLFKDLREQRHLAYTVSSYRETVDDMGTINLQIKTTTNNMETGENTPENIKKSIQGFNDNIAKITKEKVTPEELETVKKIVKNNILMNLEMNSMKNIVLADSIKNFYGINYINKKFELIDSITAEDILKTAQHVFRGKPVYSIAGTKDSLDYNKEFLSKLCTA